MTATWQRPETAPDRGVIGRSWPRLNYGGVPVDALDFDDVVDLLTERMIAGSGGYVVTPNVDHLVKARRDPALRRIYLEATLSLADGVPLVWLSKALRLPVREKVSGSDLLVPLLASAANAGAPVFVLGSAPPVAARATEVARRQFPKLEIVGSASPLVDLDGDQSEVVEALETAKQAGARLVVVALGCPKQELVMFRHGWRVPEATFVGVGASMDFLAGEVRRSPKMVSNLGLEWAFRLFQEPRRLWRRYLLDAPTVLPLFASMAASRFKGLSLVSERHLSPVATTVTDPVTHRDRSAVRHLAPAAEPAGWPAGPPRLVARTSEPADEPTTEPTAN